MEEITYKYTRIYRDMAEEKIKKDSQGEREPLDLSIYPKDDKGRYIIPTAVFLDRYRELPDNTRSDDGKYIAYNGGYCRVLTDEDRRKGAEATNAAKARKKTFKEAIEAALYRKASAKTIEELGLDKEASVLDALIANQLIIGTKASKSEATKAAEFIRDTIGEKPAEKQEITADIMTDEDRALLQKVRARQIKAEQTEQEMSSQ